MKCAPVNKSFVLWNFASVCRIQPLNHQISLNRKRAKCWFMYDRVPQIKDCWVAHDISIGLLMNQEKEELWPPSKHYDFLAIHKAFAIMLWEKRISYVIFYNGLFLQLCFSWRISTILYFIMYFYHYAYLQNCNVFIYLCISIHSPTIAYYMT